jgi:hypothetical protein
VKALVKGITRRVIMVKSPDPKLFEQAIFIMREDTSGTGGVTAEQVLQEAQRVADGYIRRNSRWGKRLGQIPSPAYAAFGALLASIVWSVALYFPF